MAQILRFFCITFFLTSSLMAQNLTGTVKDEAGNPIPYVRVYTQDNETGTTTDQQGRFLLSLPEGVHQVFFQHLGYEKLSQRISLNRDKVMQIVLQASDIQLEVIEIEAGKKDPAYAIMKEVVANKGTYVKQFEAYKRETYLKVNLERDSIPSKKQLKVLEDSLGSLFNKDSILAQPGSRVQINLIESFATNFFRFPKSYKTIVNAYRDYERGKDSGPVTVSMGGDFRRAPRGYMATVVNPYLFYLDASEADFNFYRNLIQAPTLGDRPFITPLHNTLWRAIYKYKLEGRSYIDGRVVYEISFRARNQDGPYFEGTLWVEDGLWAINKIEANVLPSTLSMFRKFELAHTYQGLEDGRRLLMEEKYTYEIKEGRNQYFGQTLAMHKEYELDPDLPRKFFRNELRRTEKAAFEQDSAAWAAIRPVGLRSAEVDFTKRQDSIIAYHQSDEYLKGVDSAYNSLRAEDYFFNGIVYRNRAQGMNYYLDPLISQPQPFGVGGYRHRLGGRVIKNFKYGTDLAVGGEVDYGFTNKDVKGRLNVSYAYAPKRFGRVFFSVGDVYTIINRFETIGAFLRRSNFINKRFIRVGHRSEITNGIYLRVVGDFADFKAIDELELSEWSESLFGSNNTPQDFDPFREFLLEISLDWTPGQKYFMEPYRKINLGSKWPTFTAYYKTAVPGFFGSELDFHYLALRARHEFKPGTFGVSRWRVEAGRFLQAKNARFTDQTFFRGSDPWFFANPLRNFQLLGPSISTRNAFLNAHYLHEFNGILMDKIPLIKRTDLQSVAGAGLLAIEEGSFLHTEVFAGFQYPFRIRTQRLKIGVYFVTAYSNYSQALQGQIKFGIAAYNPLQKRWEY